MNSPARASFAQTIKPRRACVCACVGVPLHSGLRNACGTASNSKQQRDVKTACQQRFLYLAFDPHREKNVYSSFRKHSPRMVEVLSMWPFVSHFCVPCNRSRPNAPWRQALEGVTAGVRRSREGETLRRQRRGQAKRPQVPGAMSG